MKSFYLILRRFIKLSLKLVGNTQISSIEFGLWKGGLD